MNMIKSGVDRKKNALVTTLLLGMASATLYLLLFLYSESLTHVATLIRQGHKIYVVIPIGGALIFSFVHGAFTGRFWDLLGLKAKKQVG
ncbi:MAG: hypothetical protein HW380_736 [Magnetococcales bacterium]|nr:hypothetical protein [Magnetococcales bacterium]HIJ84095.1 hypothetical protein [Magnetococcales bacterium]